MTPVQKNVSVPLSCVVICWQIRNGDLMSYVVYITMTCVKILKCKIPENISNIKQVYNIRYQYNKALMGDISEMQQLLKLLDDNNYVSRFAFLDSEKEESVTSWALKDQEEMPKVIVTDRDTTLMNSVAKVFSTSYALFYRKVCDKYLYLLKYVESTMLDQVKERIVSAWTNQLVRNISQVGLSYIFHKAKRFDNVSSDSAKCGCTIVKTYLPHACLIAMKVKLDRTLRMNEVCSHWKKLRFDDNCVMKDGKSNISNLTEWEVIQEIFLKADDNMKLHIKEQLRKIAYLDTTDLKPPSQPVKTKGATKKVKPTSNDNSTVQSSLYFEHVDKVFPDSPTPNSQKIVNVKGDNYCGFLVISALLDKGEGDHTLVLH
ncbi:uncharacterized protein LOC127095945 [Lathyrus oleraceus]|uniref:uncharacterized protein LOC127095945 n=1 Tax=Pisum sativum TaxID=3888 RepID=UPI0021D06002|nr:uncharacterized protein LOC127095945 [Pisum sativum]